MRHLILLPIPILALAACGDRPADPRGVGRNEVLLQVVATGRSDTRPNEARFTAGVQTIAASAGEASRVNAEKMNRVVAALRALGVAPDDMRTQSVTMRRVEYGENEGRFDANNMVEVRLRDVARTGPAIAAATEAGANILGGPNLTVGDPEAASRSAYAAAFRSARARADAYAEAAGMQVARVLVIRDGGEAGPPIAYDTHMSGPTQVSRAAPPPPPVQTGSQTNEVRISVDFALSR